MVTRIPVVSKDEIPLVPTKIQRAKKWVELGRAKFIYSKSLRLNYVQLLEDYEDRGGKHPSIQLGFDPGSHFDGVSVSSERCNHLNLELIQKQKKSLQVKSRIAKRSANRRLRRSRLRQRPARFDSRNSSKMVPTIRSMFNFRKFTVEEILKLFPISKAIFERVAYRGPNQFRFTQVHLGQSAFIEFLRSKISIVKIVKGYITKAKRIKLFGRDLKTSNKGEESFFAHCLDSFSLSVMGLKCKIRRIAICRFISKNWLNRRELEQEKNLTGNKRYLVKYSKGGVPNYYTRLGKPNVCYIQKYPNSFKEFDLLVNPRAEKCHKYRNTGYGGTIAKGASRSKVPRGMSKRCILKFGKIVRYANCTINLIGGCEFLPAAKDSGVSFA